MLKLLPSSVTWQKVNTVKWLSCFWCFSMNLTWRDMQHLVVRTSLPGHLIAGDWKTNGVGRIGIFLFSVVQIIHGWYFIIEGYVYPSLLHVYVIFVQRKIYLVSQKCYCFFGTVYYKKKKKVVDFFLQFLSVEPKHYNHYSPSEFKCRLLFFFCILWITSSCGSGGRGRVLGITNLSFQFVILHILQCAPGTQMHP